MISSEMLKTATEWYIRLHDPDTTAQDKQAFEQWLADSSHNQEAWAAIQQVDSPFHGLDPAVGRSVLLQPDHRAGRRQVLKAIGIVFVLGSSGALAYRTRPWQAMLADYATGKGERRTWTLPDQTVIVLNTGTTVDTRYDALNRIVILTRGEIMVQTGHPAGVQVPFQVQTRHGMVTALGTRFSVRDHGSHISVSVFEHAVSIVPAHSAAGAFRIEENQVADFNADQFGGIKPVTPGADLWVKGTLSVNDMPLQDFLTELNRYHGGVLRCDAAIATMPISGAFPLDNLDAILSNLQATYRLRTEFFTRYWITLKPA